MFNSIVNKLIYKEEKISVPCKYRLMIMKRNNVNNQHLVNELTIEDAG